MRDVLDELVGWWRAGEPVAVATVVATFRSAPRPPGATMLVGPASAGGQSDPATRASLPVVVGSVSGGCVEGAVVHLANEVLDTGRPVLQRYGISDEIGLAAGLTCGGILDVYVERVDPATFPELGEVAADVAAGRPVAVATVVEHPDPQVLGRRLIVRPGTRGSVLSGPVSAGSTSSGSLGSEQLDLVVHDDAVGLLEVGTSTSLTYGPHGERRGEGCRVFVAAYAPPPRMIVFGAIDFAAAVARMGSFLGYRVTVCDARPVFATATRFPEADEVVVDWPHRYLSAQAQAGALDARTVVCVLTHDPKFDVPVLMVALGLEIGFVGALGSRRTHDDRLKRLRDAGLSDDALARLHSPIGLDLGGRTPAETAISIAAEIVADRWAGTGTPLTETSGRVHKSNVATADRFRSEGRSALRGVLRS
jgi:xanthine dehydrogenase accessory factor